ncbi:MAG: hypothetical protein ABJN22_12635 [Litorimonas sp.]
MTRNSKNSKQNFLATTSLKPNNSTTNLNLADQLIETCLRIELAKLAKLEAETPREDIKYMRYEDMPPPSPAQEAEFYERFRKLINQIAHDDIGPEVGETVQNWLIKQGATIPDLPEWKTPLYLDKFQPARLQ